MEEPSILAEMTGVTGKWSTVVVVSAILAIVLTILGCAGIMAGSDRSRMEHDRFKQCIAAGRVWVDGNCLPAEEVQG